MNILTDTDRMQEASNELSAVYNDMRTAYTNLKNLIVYLEPTWQGSAATEYLTRLRQQLTEMKNIMDAVDAMKRTADERIRTAISLDKIESINILNISAAILDIAQSMNAAFLNLLN